MPQSSKPPSAAARLTIDVRLPSWLIKNACPGRKLSSKLEPENCLRVDFFLPSFSKGIGFPVASHAPSPCAFSGFTFAKEKADMPQATQTQIATIQISVINESTVLTDA